MRIVFFIYEGLTALDAIGPYEVLSRLPKAEVTFVSVKSGWISTDTGFLALRATQGIDETPSADVLVIPGGPLNGALGRDIEVRDWLDTIVPTTRVTATVCTGALILGAAGHLKGVRSTTHWACFDELADYGALATRARVVHDGRFYSAAGVSAGIDLGLTLARDLVDAAYAQALQLTIEYDPAPPFDAGSPERAPADVLARVQRRLQRMRDEITQSDREP